MLSAAAGIARREAGEEARDSGDRCSRGHARGRGGNNGALSGWGLLSQEDGAARLVVCGGPALKAHVCVWAGAEGLVAAEARVVAAADADRGSVLLALFGRGVGRKLLLLLL